ncbi:hypothetical protein ACTFIU_001909 [Dictyostelium citrinum]
MSNKNQWQNFNGLELKTSELEGRYLIATRDIKVGEDLLKCKSYFAVTSETLKTTSCFNCIKQLPSVVKLSLKCNQCNEVWYCNEDCKNENINKHQHYECKFYKRLKSPKLKLYPNFDIETFTEIRMVVGLLSRYYQDNLLNNKFIDELNNNNNNNNNNEQLTNTLDDVFDLVENQVTEESNSAAKERIDSIVEFIGELFNLVLLGSTNITTTTEASSSSSSTKDKIEMIKKINEKSRSIIHKTRCNQFGIWTKNNKCIGVAVSPSSSYFNHSCIPNCTDVRDGSNMTFKSLYPIKKGEQLTISYIELDQPTQDRRDELKYGYYFDCICPRCSGDSNLTDSMDDWISKFYCSQKKCTGLYYSKSEVPILNTLTTNHEIHLSCSNCNNINIVSPSFFNK